MRHFFYHLKQAWKLVFTYPVHQIDLNSTDYDAYWKDKRGSDIGKLSRWQKKRANLLLDHVNKENPACFVDIGCGDGSILKYLKEQGVTSEMVGADVSEFALAKAREFGVTAINFDINNQSDWQNIPETDYVLLFEILEHVQDSELFLNTMFEKSKKGVFFSFPNTGYILHRLRLVFGKFPLQWQRHPGEHVRFWTYRDLIWWMSALGHTTYTIRPYEGVPILNRLWPSLFSAGLFVYLEV